MSLTHIYGRYAGQEQMYEVSQLLDTIFGTVPGETPMRGANGWAAATPGCVGSPPLTTDTDGSTVTFNLQSSAVHTVTMAASRTLALSNPVVGQKFILAIVQGGSGSYTVTWFTTIKWAGGTPPTLTTSVGKTDIFEFLCMSSGTYINTWQALNC